MNDNQNLTTGNVSRKLTTFALPLLAANLLQSFYSIVDMLVVGRIVGETGLAALLDVVIIRLPAAVGFLYFRSKGWENKRII